MNFDLSDIKIGLFLVLSGLAFGISLGIGFGANEDAFVDYIAQGISAHPELHDAKSPGKIWRYVQRAHFHANGIAGFSLGLLLLVAASSLQKKMKKIASTLIGLGMFYPLSWFTMFLLSPSLGRSGAHGHFLTELFTYVGVGCLVAGFAILAGNLFFGLLSADAES
jgi:hypothetical protein